MDPKEKKFSDDFDESWRLAHQRKSGKSYMQSFELFKFMKAADIGKRISIVSPEGSSTWERIE